MSQSVRYLSAPLLALVLAIVGCGDTEAEKREADIEALAERHGVDADVTLDADGNVASVQFDSGNTSVGNNLSLPDGFPGDVPITESWNVMSVSQIPQGGFMVQAMSEASSESVVANVRSAMNSDGWSEEGFEQPTPQMSQLAFGKDNRMTKLNIMQMGQTQLMIQLVTMDKPNQG